MTILETDKSKQDAAVNADQQTNEQHEAIAHGASTSGNAFAKENIFSEEELGRDSKIDEKTDKNTKESKIIIADDKIRFIDSIVQNTRFTKDYSLFGGKVTLTLRSLTNDEVNAMSAWIINNGSNDSSGILSGRYRKYLAAAQVEMLNGVKMPPLEDPLYATLDKNGKTTIDPGWVSRKEYWENMSMGLFGAIIKCIEDFDSLYASLCAKAEDSNFWNPDTL